MEAVTKALDERDGAIQARLDQIEQKSDTMLESTEGIANRLQDLERSGGGGGPAVHTAKHRYSFAKALRHVADPDAYPLDGLEREQHEELRQKSNSPVAGATFVPLMRKDLDYGANSPTAGGSSLVPRDDRSLVDVLRQDSVIMRLASVVPVTGDVDLPKKTATSGAYWVEGEGTPVTETTPTFDRIQLRPLFCGALTTVTLKMLRQTDGVVERIVETDLLSTVAVELDRAALNGSGSGEPTGLLNQSGILDASESPQALSWGSVLEMERLLLTNNARRGNLAVVCDPSSYKSLKSTTRVSNDAAAGFVMDMDQMNTNGYVVEPTNHCPADTLVMGNWDDLIVALWGNIALARDESTHFASGSVRIRAFAGFDIQVRHAESFCKLSV
ncbi:MAG: phage major capsid protein [Pseudomonadota bacterium]